MTAVDPILLEVTSAPITATVASTGLVLTVASGTVGPAGPTGPAGSNGTNGVGVPAGGTTGQVLAKTSATNYATAWVDQTGGGGGGSGTVTEVSGTAPISVATGTTTPVVSISAATTSAAGSMSSSDKTKVDGIAAGATANATDAQLRDRSTHTGTQTLSTISDAGTAAAKNAPAAGNAAAGEVVLGSDTRLTDQRRPLWGRLSFDNVDFTVTGSTSTLVVQRGTLSAPRTVTLPSTASFAAGQEIMLWTGAGVSATNTLTVQAVSSQTINGTGTSYVVTQPNRMVRIFQNTNTGVTATNPNWIAQTYSVSASEVSGLATIATSGSASDLSAGTVPTARLGSGTASASTFLRGDQTYQPVPVGNNDMGRVSNACYLTGSGLSLNGATSGNTATAADSTALDITGDIDIVVRAALADWTLASTQILVAKRQTVSTRSYQLHVFSGNLYFATSTTGSDVVFSNSSATVGFSAGQAGWVRVTRNSTTGAVTFYTAPDSSSEPTSWTQLGTTQSTTPSSIYNSNSQLEIGSNLNGSSQPTGTIYRAIVRSGIGGTTVFDANFATAAADALAFTESSSNAATVTITTTRYSYGVPGVQFNGTGTQALTANTVYYQPFEVTAPLTLDFMALEVTTAAGSNGNLRMGVYAADANLQPTGAPLFDSGDVAVTSGATGILSKQGTPVTLQPGVYLSAANTSVALTARTALGGQTMVGTAMGSNLFTVLMSVAQTQGAFPTPGTAWTTRAAATGAARHVAQMRWR